MKNTNSLKIFSRIFVIFVLILLCGILFYDASNDMQNVYAYENMSAVDNAICENEFADSIEVFAEDGTISRLPKPISENEENIQTFSSQNFKEHKLLDSGRPDSSSFVITFMGDGFTAEEQTTFINEAQKICDKIFGNYSKSLEGMYPFNIFRDLATVYAIEVISNESGVSRDADTNNGHIVDTFFGGSYYYGKNDSDIERALVIDDNKKAVAKNLSKPESSLTAVICNSTRWGGTGGEIAVTSIHSRCEEIMVHEFGHTFGKLADEYYYISDGKFYGNEAPNRTRTNNEGAIRWKNWLGYKNVGIYPYSTGVDINDPSFDPETNNWFKPHNNCRMQFSNRDFCPVCASTIYKKIEEKVGTVFQTTKTPENTLRLDKLNFNASGAFSIPECLDGLMVTEIGPEAFANQHLCKKITFPQSLKSIGDEAFINCSDLEYTTIYDNLESIGNGAFIGCTSLKNIYISSNVNEIGERVFAGCNNLFITVSSKNPNYTSENNILYNKDKTKILGSGMVSSNLVIPSTVLEILPWAFENNTNINILVFEHSPVIKKLAFSSCYNLNEIYYYSFDRHQIERDSFLNCEFVIYVPYICRDSFLSVMEENHQYVDSKKLKVAFISDGINIGSIEVPYGSIIEDLLKYEKTGYELLGWYDSVDFKGTLYKNGDLLNSRVDLSLYAKYEPKQYFIDFTGENDEDFEPKEVWYDTIIGDLPIASKDGYTFLGWKSQDGQYYTENTIWTNLESIVLTSDWKANEYTITYDGNGGTPNKENQSVIFDSVIDEFAECERKGYEFIEWNTSIDGSGQKFVAPFDYVVANDIILYAQWKLTEYSITYDLNGGTIETPNPDKYTIETAIEKFNSPTKTGYTFVDWMNDNTPIKNIPAGEIGDLHLVAKYEANKYTVTLDPNGGTIISGDNTAQLTYSSSFTIATKVTREGYTFEGWYDSNNIKYVTPEGKSTKVWNKSSASTLYAKWTIKSYKIQINDNGSITWLGPNGVLSDEPCNIEYGTVLNAINLIATFKNSNHGFKEGQIFDHFEFEGNRVAWSKVPDLGENGKVITIKPVWILEKHTIYFNTRCEAIVNSIEADYSSQISLATNVPRTGYTFKGWYTSAEGGTQVTWITMPDLTPTEQNNGSIELFAHWEANPYTVTLDKQGGTGGTASVTATFNAAMPSATAPTRTGYTFQGYYAQANGKGTKYYNANMTSAHNWDQAKATTLYAYWIANPYTVTLDKQGGTGGTASVTATFNATMPSATAPTRTGYTFQGYYAQANGKGTKYYNANMTSAHVWDQAKATTLYAHWKANPYTVKLDKQGGTGGTDSVVATFNGVMPVTNVTAPTRTGYTFHGYYAQANGKGTKYYNANMTSAHNWDQAKATTIYAYWIVNKYEVTLDRQGGTGGTTSVTATYNAAMPSTNVTSPTRTGYTFQGYYSAKFGGGVKYYNSNMSSAKNWTITGTGTLYAHWTANPYTVTFDKQGGSGGTASVTATFNMAMPTAIAPTKAGYTFKGYYSEKNGKGTQYYGPSMRSTNGWNISRHTTLYAHWSKNTYRFIIDKIHAYEGVPHTSWFCDVDYFSVQKFTADESFNYREYTWDGKGVTYDDTRLFTRWRIIWGTADNYDANSNPWREYSTSRDITFSIQEVAQKYYPNIENGDIITIRAIYNTSPPSCIANDSLITLADGTQLPVQNLKGNEKLLVWNLHTGSFDVAPILFIDSDPSQKYEVINLHFSDDTCVKVISEHAFWDCDLNKYVFLRADAAKYIGHWFNKQITSANGEMKWTKVQLVDVELTTEITTAWSPVTYGHLCYYVNGMLSMPGATESFINIFDVDAETMKIDEVAFEQDIETYGLFTYEEFAELLPIPEVIFEAFGGQYLKVAIGKGLTTMKELAALIQRYEKFFN